MERELRNPPGVHMPQAHYSHVARVGNTLYLAGQLGMDVSGKVVGVGDAKAQARQCYENLATILAHYGGGLRHLVKTTTFITGWIMILDKMGRASEAQMARDDATRLKAMVTSPRIAAN